MPYFITVFITVILNLTLSFLLTAKPYPLPPNNHRLIGENTLYTVKKGDFFQPIAETFDVGFLALMAANPEVDPFLPKPDTQLIIPHQLILPFTKRVGIVINLPELRLYYFDKTNHTVHVFPIGVGKQGLETPNLVSFISDKYADPVWRPSDEMRQRWQTEKNKTLPKEILPGPNNPLGKYALRIGHSEYLIHGTNQRFGIGMRSSSGCIRMYDDDIEWLFNHIKLNTPIRIIDQPFKMSYEDGTQQLIEIHSPMSDMPPNLHQKALDSVQRFLAGNQNMGDRVEQLLLKPKGLVVNLQESHID